MLYFICTYVDHHFLFALEAVTLVSLQFCCLKYWSKSFLKKSRKLMVSLTFFNITAISLLSEIVFLYRTVHVHRLQSCFQTRRDMRTFQQQSSQISRTKSKTHAYISFKNQKRSGPEQMPALYLAI